MHLGVFCRRRPSNNSTYPCFTSGVFIFILAIIGGIVAFILGLAFVPLYGGKAVAAIQLAVNSLIILVESIRVIFIVRKFQKNIKQIIA